MREYKRASDFDFVTSPYIIALLVGADRNAAESLARRTSPAHLSLGHLIEFGALPRINLHEIAAMAAPRRFRPRCYTLSSLREERSSQYRNTDHARTHTRTRPRVRAVVQLASGELIMEIPRVTKYLIQVSLSTPHSLRSSLSLRSLLSSPSFFLSYPSAEFVNSRSVFPRGGQPAYNDSR